MEEQNKSCFIGCSLYESMIEGADEKDVHDTLLIELKKRNLTENDFMRIKNGDLYFGQTQNVVDAMLYFGVPNFSYNLSKLIKFAIRCKTLHKMINFGIVFETFKENIIKDGYEEYINNVMLGNIDDIQGHHSIFFDRGESREKKNASNHK